ncbi:P-loop containing nucleoside triphosphate hydrolase protein [Trichoderma sp. SZMC 28012]
MEPVQHLPASGGNIGHSSSHIPSTLDAALPTAFKEIGYASESDGGKCSTDESDHGSDTSGFSLIPQQPSVKPATPKNPLEQKVSAAAHEWGRRKQQGEKSSVLEKLMQYQGLEEVKQYFLDIKSKVDIWKEQDPDGTMNVLSLERFNVVFQGNPGAGKTTVARLYAKFLHDEGILVSEYILETSGAQVALEGASGMQRTIEEMTKYGRGGIVFIDEAYQLMANHTGQGGKQALDILLAALENNIGSIAAVFVGYNDEMAPFFEHNRGLESRIPHTINFADFDDGELWQIFTNKLHEQYDGGMRVEGDVDGLYVRIAIRRLAQARGSRGFGNARAVENLLNRIRQRQARRLMREKNEMQNQTPDCRIFTREDLIGPDPSVMARTCPAWIKLQELIGLEEVKQAAERLIGMIELNYQRELREEPPIKFSLNQIFVGAPGTGKTTVAKLYGQILVDLGYLSRGDIILKTPADFIGDALGTSEAKTRTLLESTVGKVLVIDEAYMLDAGDSNKDQDKFKTGIIDTIVSMTQGLPGEDRCIILVGYEDKMHDLFQNVNPGFSRRFPVKNPFHFKNFTIDQLEEILRLKMIEDDLICTDDAIAAARELLTQALMRPSFTNAGEVNSVLTAAKMNYGTRISRLPLEKKLSAAALEAIDFDPEFILKRNFEPGCDKTLEGRVDSHIIDQLVGYQRSYCLARKRNLDPRTFAATNFIFKGPSGTGKMTTARHMGKIFYDMGFVSTKDVVEYAATDLIGQYVGQTAPKTRKKLKDGLGRVLVISDSGRLLNGSYAAEAMEELLQFLANPLYAGKIVIVLTGSTADMNKLLSQYPTLSGFFTEELLFEAISPDDCVKLLLQELEVPGIDIKLDILDDRASDDYCKVRHLFGSLGAQSGWSNARDIKNLAKQIIKRAFFDVPEQLHLDQELSLTFRHVIETMEKTVSLRRGRARTSDSARRSGSNPSPVYEDHREATAPPQHRMNTYSNTPSVVNTRPGSGSTEQSQSFTNYKTLPQLNPFFAQNEDSPAMIGDKRQQAFSDNTNGVREGGVSDEDWQDLCKKKKDHAFMNRIRKMKVQTLERQLASFEETEDAENAELFRTRLTEAQKKIAEEEKIQKTLREMGRCVNGFSWTRDGEGYRCEGGMHFVADKDLLERM